MPLFHPAYLLRHQTRAPGGPRSLTWRDIREAAAVLRGEKAPEGLAAAGPTELGDLLAAVRSADADPLAAARTELKEYLLGPDEPTSMERFNAAVRDLKGRAEARNEGQNAAADLPGQRTGTAVEPGPEPGPGAAAAAGTAASADS